MPTTLPDPMLTTDEVADYLRVPKSTLYRWRHHREGPKASPIGKHLRYRLSDVDAWIEAQGASDGESSA